MIAKWVILLYYDSNSPNPHFLPKKFLPTQNWSPFSFSSSFHLILLPSSSLTNSFTQDLCLATSNINKGRIYELFLLLVWLWLIRVSIPLIKMMVYCVIWFVIVDWVRKLLVWIGKLVKNSKGSLTRLAETKSPDVSIQRSVQPRLQSSKFDEINFR